MSKRVFASRVAVLLGLCFGGCTDETQVPSDYDFPTAPPIWIVEEDRNTTNYERGDLERDRAVGKMLVIPLYTGFHYDNVTDRYAIAHPFVYSQGESIEKQLTSSGQRETLRALIIWVPGYFPGSIGRTFPWVPTIGGKRMIVLELQPCAGVEEREVNSAMKDLLTNGDFVIQEMSEWKACPPYSNHATRVDEPYDFAHLVRSVVFQGRYFRYGCANEYVLWGFSPGTEVMNRLSAEEKKTVERFVEQAQQAKER
jgi:hypothetical protein